MENLVFDNAFMRGAPIAIPVNAPNAPSGKKSPDCERYTEAQILQSGWQKTGRNEFRFDAFSIRQTPEGWQARHKDGAMWTPQSYQYPSQAITVAPTAWHPKLMEEKERAHASFQWIWETPAKATVKRRASKPSELPTLSSLPLFGL